MGEVATIARLETLLSLYSKGFQSPVVDQTIAKLVHLETDRIQYLRQNLVTGDFRKSRKNSSHFSLIFEQI